MSVLLIAEHNNKELKPFTLNAVTAASQIDQDLHVLVIGHNAGDVAKSASNIPLVKKVIHVDDAVIENNQIRIPFSIELWEIKGSIWTNLEDGSPEKITFIQDDDLKVDINIKSSVNSADFTPPKYDFSEYEVVNLIE